MSTKKSHTSIQQFKEFVKRHPKLVQEVRKGQKEWQEVFEDWYLLGENDIIWNQYKEEKAEEAGNEEEDKVDFMSQMLTAVKKMDMNQVNHHISNMSNTITTIQQLFDQFGLTKGGNKPSSGGNQHPFSFRKD
ncbi:MULTISPECIES: YlbD family protein [Bacillaceae]|uniref:YlbD family protein n=1 Tax=Metabacillus sp. 22489 TaxID=3453928 RepID=UPI000BA7D7E0|nr:hypothetical protein CHH83_04855 [Bacillus sp. 7586-K]